jgi:glutaredoxin
MRLRIYGRSYCHLCDELVAALRPLQAQLGFELEVFDVDAHPDLERQFGERVPVLVDSQGAEICHYWLNEDALRRHLALE